MAVTWIDTPNVAISRREPLDFIVTTNPVAISVKFPGLRSEERVWRDSAFQYPYLNSTVTGSGPYTFHLNRTGGWPADSTVYVDEAGGDSGVQPWGVLYEVDFRVQPAASFNGAGSYTIDGLTWWQKERAGIAPAYTFTLSSNGLFVGGPNATGTVEGSVNQYGRRMILPLANIPGYNPAAPVCFFVRTLSATPAAFSQAVCGVMDCTQSAAALTEAELHRRQGISGHQDNSHSSFVWKGSSNFLSTSILLSGLANNNVGRVVHVQDRRTVGMSAFDWSGATPNPLTGAMDAVANGNAATQFMLGSVTISGTPTTLLRDMSNLSFYVAYNNGAGAGGANCYLQQLVVWQPGA
jgi:hypothetical protein